MKLMETGNNLINGSLINTSGYLGLHTQTPWSMFHIQGPNNTPWGGNGFREWMITGVYSMENSDNLFVGMKDEDFNRSDAIWAGEMIRMKNLKTTYALYLPARMEVPVMQSLSR